VTEAADDRVWFSDQLPACCAAGPLRLPRPVGVQKHIANGDDLHAEDLGLVEWTLRVGVQWEYGEEDLADALGSHLGRRPASTQETLDVLSAHGVAFDDLDVAWVGVQTFVVAYLGNWLGEAAGNHRLRSGSDLLYAADAESPILEQVVGAVVETAKPGHLWSAEVLQRWPESDEASALIVLLGARITPALRGHHLGAWAAAQSIAQFDQQRSLVVGLASPIATRDVLSEVLDEDREWTELESARWRSQERWLAGYGQAHLGLSKLSDPNLLGWYSGETNPTLEATLRDWSG